MLKFDAHDVLFKEIKVINTRFSFAGLLDPGLGIHSVKWQTKEEEWMERMMTFEMTSALICLPTYLSMILWTRYTRRGRWWATMLT